MKKNCKKEKKKQTQLHYWEQLQKISTAREDNDDGKLQQTK